ncbi:MAG: hypothetical protein ACOYW3_17320 [Bacteroidota bacterium]
MKPALLLCLLLLACPLFAQHTAELTPAEVLKLVPDKIKGFRADEDFKSKQMNVGTVSYSLCEKKFDGGGDKSIKILLFDFKNAPIMYSQAMRKWNNADPVESDSLILRVVTMDNCTGWEWYSKNSGTSQIFLGICDRFFLNMTGENVELDKLKDVVKEIKLDKFPK